MLPEFQPLTAKNRSLLQKVCRGCPYRLSDLSAGMKPMWKSDCRPEFALFSGCLLVKNGAGGKVRYFGYRV